MFAPQFSLPAFAKINWSLRVLGKRPDGYHEVETVLQTISLQDTLHFEPIQSSDITLVCDKPGIPKDNSNLIVRAARALQSRKGVTGGVRIHLDKVIPSRAGLGGASANAAIALIGLAQLWETEISSAELDEIGSAIGADVPFFFHGGRALARGTGASITRLPDIPEQPLLVVTPAVGVSTVEAYAALESPTLTSNRTESILSIFHVTTNSPDSDQWLKSEYLHNDFQRVIFDIEPEIERASSSLVKAGATGVLLAGSGSSVFGIFESLEAQQRAQQWALWEPGWQIFPCVTLSREEYLLALSPWGTSLLRSFDIDSNTGA